MTRFNSSDLPANPSSTGYPPTLAKRDYAGKVIGPHPAPSRRVTQTQVDAAAEIVVETLTRLMLLADAVAEHEARQTHPSALSPYVPM